MLDLVSQVLIEVTSSHFIQNILVEHFSNLVFKSKVYNNY